ncbi:MAG: PaaI family thioesterase [Syntrophorhabdaceae bacterium]|nr:PaaI family thioesterase [Syntrophorhabdaceae bacterium]MDD5244987.1 PaaI family thioesterase [Syntrophorhabdaceae bacterium]
MTGLLPGYKKCFFCGPATGGLALGLQHADGAVFCEFTADQKYQGYDGVMHGGIVSGILDEVMWWALFMETKIITATSKIEVEFRRPIICGEAYRAKGQVLRSVHGTYNVSGLIENASGHVCAKAHGFYRKTKGFTVEDIIRHLDFRGVSPEVRALFQLTEGMLSNDARNKTSYH